MEGTMAKGQMRSNREKKKPKKSEAEKKKAGTPTTPTFGQPPQTQGKGYKKG
jgi:hypothetical protein